MSDKLEEELQNLCELITPKLDAVMIRKTAPPLEPLPYAHILRGKQWYLLTPIFRSCDE